MKLATLLNTLAVDTQPLTYFRMDGHGIDSIYVIDTGHGNEFAACRCVTIDHDAFADTDAENNFVTKAVFGLSAEDNSAEEWAAEACCALAAKRNEYALKRDGGEVARFVWQSTAAADDKI